MISSRISHCRGKSPAQISPRGAVCPLYLAAPAPTLLGYLSTLMSFRTAAMAMSLIYLLGMIALIWAPETKGKALPED